MSLFKRKRFKPYTTTFRGHRIHIHDHASFRLGYNEMFKEEIYKFRSGKTDPFIIDCGSNLGMSIIYFKSIYPAARIIGFEADPFIFSFLEKNIQSYQFSEVTVINKAVWDISDETMSFMAEGGAGGRLQERSGSQKFIDVKTTRLKDYLKEEVDFLKLDIEGAEHRVIADCADQLKMVKNLFIEYHSMPDRPQALHDILDTAYKAGFRYHIKEAYTTAFPFIERKLNVGMDLQLNIFCYRS